MNRVWESVWKIPVKLRLAAVVFVLVFIFVSVINNQDSDYETYQVRVGHIDETVVISGNINDADNAKIFSPSTGIVEEVYISNGDSVEIGQQLLKVQSTALESDRSAKYATYQAALSSLQIAKQAKITNQSSLEDARKSVIDASIARQQMEQRRIKGAVNPSTGEAYTQDEIDSVNSTYESAKTSFQAYEKKYLDSDTAIAAANSAVTAALFDYHATVNGVIKAPVSGTVANLSVGVGDYIRAKSSSLAATGNDDVALRILRGEAPTVLVKLNEIDVAKVHPGQNATIQLDAIPDRTFTGSVVRVDVIGENDNAVVTYKTFITLEEKDERIRPTMTATVTIATDRIDNVLVIPNRALIRADDGKIMVWKIQGRTQIQIPIIPGKKNATLTQVVNGLSDGDTILIPNK